MTQTLTQSDRAALWCRTWFCFSVSSFTTREPLILPSCKVLPPPSLSLRSATSAGSAGGQMKRMYSAVPGRVYVATRAHSALGERELSLSKGDKVKGQFSGILL